MTERKHALVRLKQGDYVLPSNDGKTLWRIVAYIDGPSAGLNVPRDFAAWQLWRWCWESPGLLLDLKVTVSLTDWKNWTCVSDCFLTRHAAMEYALKR